MSYLWLGIIGGSLIVFLSAILGTAIYIWKTYNLFISLRIKLERQGSHLQAHLKKKFDLIPALVETVKGYAKHEKGTFEKVTQLRSQWGASKDADKKLKTANMLESTLSKILLIQENYPRLKANKNFLGIQKSLSRVESELLHERKVYNKRVSWYNLRIEKFPTLLIAKMFGFKSKEFYTQKD